MENRHTLLDRHFLKTKKLEGDHNIVHALSCHVCEGLVDLPYTTRLPCMGNAWSVETNGQTGTLGVDLRNDDHRIVHA